MLNAEILVSAWIDEVHKKLVNMTNFYDTWDVKDFEKEFIFLMVQKIKNSQNPLIIFDILELNKMFELCKKENQKIVFFDDMAFLISKIIVTLKDQISGKEFNKIIPLIIQTYSEEKWFNEIYFYFKINNEIFDLLKKLDFKANCFWKRII